MSTLKDPDFIARKQKIKYFRHLKERLKTDLISNLLKHVVMIGLISMSTSTLMKSFYKSNMMYTYKLNIGIYDIAEIGVRCRYQIMLF